MTTVDDEFDAYAPLPARRQSTDLIDTTAWQPDDPAKQRKAALNVIAWFGYPDAGTQAWDEAVEVLDMCGLREALR